MSRTYAHLNHILADLEKHAFISQYDVIKYESTLVKFQLKLRIEFTNQSVLFTNEFLGDNVRKYAFHWQKTDDDWLMRWDNAPHFPKLASFPHHKHDFRTGTDVVTNSFDIALVDVLSYIHDQLTNS